MACNPVATYNQYTSNGSTTTYNFTFPYIKTSDVQVQVITDNPTSENTVITDLTVTTHYSVSSSNPTQIVLTSAGLTIAANGSTIRIYRCTDNQFLTAEFQAGSAIRATDLNTNFDQALYTTQEANVRSTDANTTSRLAVTTAETLGNQAIATANTAVTTANSAVTTSNAAVVTANSAVATANASQLAVANAVFYAPYANVASIPGSPSHNDYIEVNNSTGIESFSPLSGLPSGFVGSAGLTVRLKYVTNSWVWQNYFANDSESRYLTKNLPVVTGDSTNGSGQITLNCENNSHGIKIKGPPHSAGANYTLTLPNDTGSTGQALTTNGSGVLSFATIDSAFIETPQSITTNKVIAANINAGMMGPTVAINSGVFITVGANSQLTVLN